MNDSGRDDIGFTVILRPSGEAVLAVEAAPQPWDSMGEVLVGGGLISVRHNKEEFTLRGVGADLATRLLRQDTVSVLLIGEDGTFVLNECVVLRHAVPPPGHPVV